MKLLGIFSILLLFWMFGCEHEVSSESREFLFEEYHGAVRDNIVFQ